MIEHIKKWALEKLLSDFVKKINIPNRDITAIWKLNKEEIVTKIVQSIEKIIIDCIMKSLKDSKIEITGERNGQSNN